MRKVLKERRLLYCWQDEASQYEVGSEAWAEVKARGDGLCMLLAGHAGPHVFTPDDKIVVTFGERDEAR